MVIGVQRTRVLSDLSRSTVHGAGGGKGSVGDDFAESNGLVVLGDRVFMPHPDYNLFGSKESLLLSSVDVLGMAAAGVAVGEGAIGSLACLAAVKSSRHTFHVAIKHASRPFRRSSNGKWISFSGVWKVILFSNFSIHSVILSSLAKNIARLFLIRIPAQSRYSIMGLSSGIPLSVSTNLKSAWRLAMAQTYESLRR